MRAIGGNTLAMNLRRSNFVSRVDKCNRRGGNQVYGNCLVVVCYNIEQTIRKQNY